MKIQNIKFLTSGFEIKIPDRIKISRKGASQPLLKIPKFDKDPRCCAARALEQYLIVTESLRGTTQNLFISTTKPHEAVGTQTISRWIRSTLHKCGEDQSYTAHNTRHASTSTAAKKGLRIDIISSTACWSERSQMFAKVYDRPIISNQSFCTAVFS